MATARSHQRNIANRLVLIADPDAAMRALYRSSLGLRGWDVEEADEGTDALAKAFSHCPTLIVAETRLPTIDGYTLCALLRSDAQTRSIPVLLLTAVGCVAHSERARLAGVDAVLGKPCLPERLIQEIDWLIEHAGELPPRRTSPPGEPSRSDAFPKPTSIEHTPMVRARQRFVTTTPALAPPIIFCPSCGQRLAYDRSHLGGVSDRFPEQWDYYVCAKCGTFQYRQRTRKLRRVQ